MLYHSPATSAWKQRSSRYKANWLHHSAAQRDTRKKAITALCITACYPHRRGTGGRTITPFSALLYHFPFSLTTNPPSTAHSPPRCSAGQLLPAVNSAYGIRARPAVMVESRKAAAPCCRSSFGPQGLGCGRGDDIRRYHQHIWTRWPCLNTALQRDKTPSQPCIRTDRRKQGTKRVNKGKPKPFLKLSWNLLI